MVMPEFLARLMASLTFTAVKGEKPGSSGWFSFMCLFTLREFLLDLWVFRFVYWKLKRLEIEKGLV